MLDTISPLLFSFIMPPIFHYAIDTLPPVSPLFFAYADIYAAATIVTAFAIAHAFAIRHHRRRRSPQDILLLI